MPHGAYQKKMIGKIKGKIIKKDNQFILLETALGISFWVKMGTKIFEKLNENEEIEVYTFLYVGEKDFLLFGFENIEQYYLFKLLLQIENIGPRLAHNIVTFATKEEIFKAVEEENLLFFTQIPGIGKKTATRIILEISTHLKKEQSIKELVFTEDDKLLFETLKKLGFRQKEIAQIFNKIPKNIKLEERLKIALSQLKKDEN